MSSTGKTGGNSFTEPKNSGKKSYRGSRNKADRTSGLTNGLGRTNGLTNGLGRTNGLTNGLGRTNGLTNGLGRTNGLTNGLGRTNGLTNGLGRTNGLTNGLSGSSGRLPHRLNDRAISPSRTSLVLILVFLLIVPTIFLSLSKNDSAYSGFRIDGDFSDWDDSDRYQDFNNYPTAALDIMEYSAATNSAGNLFLYANAGANWMSSPDVDSLVVFIDADNNPGTGYAVRGMGAEYVTEVYGWEGAIRGRQMGVFSGSDRDNWGSWNWRGLFAAVSLNQMEISIPGPSISLNPEHGLLFMTKRGETIADVCSARIALDRPALSVRQIPGGSNGIIGTDQVMSIELRACGQDVTVTSIGFACTGVAAPTVAGLPVTVQAGTAVQLQVTAPVTGLARGTFVDIAVSSVSSSALSTVSGDGLVAYAIAAPSGIMIDGAFGDWNAVSKSADPADSPNPNTDIRQQAAVNGSSNAYFYLKTGDTGTMMGGCCVPNVRTKPAETTPEPVEPVEPIEPAPEKNINGEDIVRLYIDTVAGGQNIGGIRADYLLEIRGREGLITSRTLYSLPSRTFVATVNAKTHGTQLETGLPLASIRFNGTMQYLIQSTDWNGNTDVTLPSAIITPALGTRGTPDPDWGPANIPVCTEARDQTNPKATPDGQGGTIITWTDFRISDWNVYAQRLSSSGGVLWAANGVPVCTATNTQSYLAIIPDGEGGAIISWTDTRSGAGSEDIYAQRLRGADGSPVWTANGIWVGAAINSQYDAQMIPDGEGGAILAWTDLRSGTSDIFAQHIRGSDGYLLWGGGRQVCTATGTQERQKLASDGQGGAIITWKDRRNGVDNDIYAQRVNGPTGASLWTANGVPVCTASNYQEDPSIISDGQGGALVVWYDYRNSATTSMDIYAQRIIASDGSPMWDLDGVPVVNVPDYQGTPQIAPDGQGGAIIAWRDNRNLATGVDLYMQRINPSGKVHWPASGLPICNAPGDQDNFQISSDGQGGAILSWRDQRNGNHDIYAQRTTQGGAALWEPNGIAVCTAPLIQDRPLVILDNRWLSGVKMPQQSGIANEFKGAIIIWQDWRNGNYDIFAQAIIEDSKEFAERHGLDPRWGDPAVNTVVCNAANSQAYVEAAMDGQGSTYLVWADKRAGTANYDIYSQRLAADGTVMWIANGVPVSTATANAPFPQIIPDGVGGAYISWMEDITGTDKNVYVRRIDRDGTLLWASKVPVSDSTGFEQYQKLVPDGRGGAIVVWANNAGAASSQAFAQRIDSTGARLWGTLGVSLSSISPQYAGHPEAIPDGRGGVIVAWHDWQDYVTNYNIRAQRVDCNGALQWGAAGVSVCDAAGDETNLRMATDGQGGAIIVWDTYVGGANFNVYAQRISAAGVPLWADDGVAVCTAGGVSSYDSYPVVIPDGRGGAIIAWEDYRSDPWYGDIYAQRLDRTGAAQWTADGEAICATGTAQWLVNMVPDGNGGALVAYHDYDTNELYLQRVNADGSTNFESSGLLVSSAAGTPATNQKVTITIDGQGGAVVAWAGDRNLGVSYDIYAQRVPLTQSTILINEVMFGSTEPVPEDWYSEYWPFRIPLTVGSTGTMLSNYQVGLSVSHEAQMQADFDDIRFTSGDGKTPLNYWVESKTDGTFAAVWVKVPSISATGDETIYMYYGNENAVTASSGNDTFDVFDDFWGNALDASKWSVPFSGNAATSYSVSGGNLNIDLTGNRASISAIAIESSTLVPSDAISDYLFESRVFADQSGGYSSWAMSGMCVGVPDSGGGEFESKFNLGWNGISQQYGLHSWNGALQHQQISVTDASWHNYRLHMASASSAEASIDSASAAASWSIGTTSSYEIVLGGQTEAMVVYNFDWFRVRKYAAAEPAVTAGTPEDITSCLDWFELFNPTQISYDLHGWKLLDGTGATVYAYASPTMAPGDYELKYVGLDLEASGCLALVDPMGAVRDFVAWGVPSSEPSGSFYDLAVSSGNWYAGTYIDVTSHALGDSIARDMASADTNTILDWDIGSGIDAEHPTPGGINAPEFTAALFPILGILCLVIAVRRRRIHG